MEEIVYSYGTNKENTWTFTKIEQNTKYIHKHLDISDILFEIYLLMGVFISRMFDGF